MVGGGFYFFQRFSDNNASISQIQSENMVLENRIEVLKSLTEELSEYVDVAYSAVPESNAGLIAINAIKQMQGERQIFIDSVNVRTSLSEVGTQQLTEVGFEVSGEINEVMAFAQALSSSLPLLRMKEMETRLASDNFATARLNMEVVSKYLPVELPSIKEPLEVLSWEDKEMLSKIKAYSRPSLVTDRVSSDESAAGSYGRSNPFSSIQQVVLE